MYITHMGRYFSSLILLGACAGSVLAAEIDSTSNSVFDLYFFGNDEAGMFGRSTGVEWMDSSRRTSGHVADSATYYWDEQRRQAMLNAVNTWTTAITTPYDTEKHARKLRIGFFLDDGSTEGGIMDSSMAGYAATQLVTTQFEPEYGGGKANIYSVAEWAWRDNNITSGYDPDWVMEGAYWETEILTSEHNSIDIAIVLNPVITSIATDAQGNTSSIQTARTADELQCIATHEIGHGMGMDSYLYSQGYDATGEVVARLSGNVSTWDGLVTLDGENIVTVTDGTIDAAYATLQELQAAGWVCNGDDPTNPDSYTGDEIQYDPARRLSLNGELGVHISATMLEGDTLEHLAYGDGTNVLGPGGTANTAFSAADLRALQMLGWQTVEYVPEPATATLSLLALAALAARRRRR